MKMKARHPCIIIHYPNVNILSVCCDLFKRHEVNHFFMKVWNIFITNGWVFHCSREHLLGGVALEEAVRYLKNSNALLLCV